MMTTTMQMVYSNLESCTLVFNKINALLLVYLPLQPIIDCHFISSLFVEDDPDDVDFEPDSETDKAVDKVFH